MGWSYSSLGAKVFPVLQNISVSYFRTERKEKEKLRLMADLSLKGNQIPKRITWRVFSGLRQRGWEGACLLKFHPDRAWEHENT